MKQEKVLLLSALITGALLWLITAPLPRYALAFVFLWILPGLAWARLLPSGTAGIAGFQPACGQDGRGPTFPELTPFERLITGLGLSFVFTPTLTLLAHYLPGPLTRPLLISSILIGTCAPLALAHVLSKKKLHTPVIPASTGPQTAESPDPPTFFSKAHAFLGEGWAWLLIAILIAGALRLTYLDYAEFQGDEGIVMVQAAQALEGDTQIIFQHNKGPAELTVAMATWRLTGIINEWMARMPFTWANLLGLTAVFLLARRLSSPRAAGIAVCLLAIEGYVTAFGRISQYQSLVFLLSTLGLLCLLVYHEGGSSHLVLFSAALFAGGFLGHYDAALALSPGLLLIGHRLWQDHRQGYPLPLRTITAAALLGLALIAQFYVPFLTSPFMQEAASYLAGRMGTGQPFYNNLPATLKLTLTYDSIYLLTFLLLFLGIQLLHTWAKWGKPLHAGLAAFLAVAALSAAVWPERWMVGERLTFAWLPAALLLIGALLAPGQSLQRRAVWIWVSLPALFYLFFVDIPHTHVHTALAPGIILGSIEIAALMDHLEKRPNVVRWTAAALGIGLYTLCGGYTIMMFVDHTPEYQRTFPEFRSSLYWIPYQELPTNGLFGFPYRAGWKVVGYLMDQGELSTYYKSNEEPAITDFYTRQATWWSCPNPDLYIIATDVQDEMGVSRRQIRNDYHPATVVQISGQPKLMIHERGPAATAPMIYDDEAYDWLFDQGTTPERIAGSGPKIEQAMPGSDTYIPLDYALGDFATLRGYSLNTRYAAPAGHVDLTVIWEVTGTTSIDYQVFNHLYDGQVMYGQLDQQPVCGTYPTSQWKPGQVIIDRYRVPIAKDAPLKETPLLIGMYDPATMERAPVASRDGPVPDNTAHLADVSVQAAE